MTIKYWLLVLLLIGSCRFVLAQPSFNVYVLCVGSAHYDTDFTHYEKGFNGYSPLPSAATSARQMHRLFRQHGAVYADTLISTPRRLVTRQATFAAIDRLVARARVDRKPNPLIVFYFCGHGQSEGFGWNLFMMPGDFRYRIDRGELLDLSKKTLYAGDIMDRLESAKLPVLALLDCCYEGKAEYINTQDFAYQQSLLQVADLTKNVMAIVRKMNEFNIENPVVFSAKPSTLAESVTMTIDNRTSSIGPLCRRALLAAAYGQQQSQPLQLTTYIDRMVSSALAYHYPGTSKVDQPLTNWNKAECTFSQTHLK